MPDVAMAGRQLFLPLPDASKLFISLGAAKVSAGFPSPAADYEDKRLDINEYLIRNPVSNFSFGHQRAPDGKQSLAACVAGCLLLNPGIKQKRSTADGA